MIHICTPNHVHFDQAKAALESGKHVMCEKPLAMDVRQSSALVELAQKHKGVGGASRSDDRVAGERWTPGAFMV